MGAGPAITRAWAMPSRWTFKIGPIAELLDRHCGRPGLTILDPFAGSSRRGTLRNDIRRSGIDSLEWMQGLLAASTAVDVVLFDPPYSPRQISEVYQSAGVKVTQFHTSSAWWREMKEAAVAMLKPEGLAITFGWNTNGFARLPIIEILLVAHGGAHNDTLVTVQRNAPK